ncbi:hypothetical protein BX666DRAFT_1853488 [Dichotomocladium elegans]|nr:hypothetical protein BX666DRAFT_1853488 [Dichotomocladium elegans]
MDSQVNLDTHSWIALAIFLCAIVFVIRSVTIHLWKITIHLNLATAPPLGIVILLASKTITWQTVGDGFIGSKLGVQPYSIMLLFYSLAYICISLDATGLIQFCAFWVSRKAGQRGHLAFTLFYLLTSLISGLASNDVVILTGTAFLSYFTRVSDIHPTAFLMSEFTSANIASMALFIGNPTNVVVSEAFNISFVTYSAWMLLPTVVCLGVAYISLRVVFNSPKYLPRVIYPPDAEPRTVLVDPKGAIFGLVLLGTCLATLVGTSFIPGVSVWMVTLPFAVIMLCRDMWYDLWELLRRSGNDVDSARTRISPSMHEVQSDNDTTISVEADARARTSLKNEEVNKEIAKPLAKVSEYFSKHLPCVTSVVTRMPWTILPFALSMFVLVEGLSHVGWIAVFAKGLSVVTYNYVATVFGVMGISIIACQLLNNLPMTILFTRILQHPNFSHNTQLPEIIVQAAVLGLIVGSNLGACLTQVGSLAGIMFEHILKTKGIYILGYFNFLKWNLILLPLVAAAGAGVVTAELWFHYLR